MSFYPANFLSNLEMTWLKKPDFFPNRDQALQITNSICLGTKSRNLGNALILTPLVSSLHRHYPELKIFSFARAFNPVVFYNHPNISRVCYFPEVVFGDDCVWDSGHVVHQFQNYFGLLEKGPEKPILFLSPDEKKWARHWRVAKWGAQQPVQREQSGGGEKKICVIHIGGSTWKDVLPQSFWEKIIEKWKDRFHFLQVGMKGDRLIAGAMPFFLAKNYWNARQLFALMDEASAFLGIDSGPMHVARAFSVPSLIFIKGDDPEAIFDRRGKLPYYLGGNWKFANLYKDNWHLRVDGDSEARLLTQVESRVEKFFNQDFSRP